MLVSTWATVETFSGGSSEGGGEGGRLFLIIHPDFSVTKHGLNEFTDSMSCLSVIGKDTAKDLT